MRATTPSREIRQVMNQTMKFDYIYKDVGKIAIQLKSNNFDTSNLFKISSTSINVAKILETIYFPKKFLMIS